MKYTTKEISKITGLTLNAAHKRLSKFRRGKISEAELFKPRVVRKSRPPKKTISDYEQEALSKIPEPSELEKHVFG